MSSDAGHQLWVVYGGSRSRGHGYLLAYAAEFRNVYNCVALGKHCRGPTEATRAV